MAPIMGGRQDRWHCEHGAPLNVYCTEAPSMCTMCTAAQRPPVKVYTVHCTEAMCTLCISQRVPLNAFKGGVGAFTRGGCCHNIITSHPKFLLQALSNGQWKMGAKMFSTIFYQSALESNNWRCVSRELNVTFLL